jgi:HAD superfamily hydrolase (TIGR01490 family)
MSVAFFDVDETLLAFGSIVRFLEFDMRADGRGRAEYELALAPVRAAGDRHASLRAFARLFAGRRTDELADRGRRWFEAERACGELFHPTVLAAFKRHAAVGDLLVLVSGSFPACLEPIAVHLGADVLVCSRPRIRGGRYTGELVTPMIGEAKAAAARDEARTRGIAVADCFAYGDHASDLPLLEQAGAACVVGDDPILNAAAKPWRWAQLPSARAAARAALEPLAEAA